MRLLLLPLVLLEPVRQDVNDQSAAAQAEPLGCAVEAFDEHVGRVEGLRRSVFVCRAGRGRSGHVNHVLTMPHPVR